MLGSTLAQNVFSFEWEDALILFLQTHFGDVGTFIATVFTYLGETVFIVGVFAVVYFWINKEAGKFAATNLMAASVFNPMIKNVALRLRPYMANDSIQCLKPVEKGDIMNVELQGYSFPSGHSSASSTVYLSFARFFRKKAVWIVAIAATALVGFSRFYLGVHYPTDVLAGWLLGVLIVVIVGSLQKTIQKKWILYLILLAVSVPGWFYCKSADFYTGFGMMAGFFAGSLFEERFIGFKDPEKWYIGLIRTVGTVAIYFALNTLLKLPFPKEMLEAGDFTAHAIRAARYCVILFAVVGLYPFAFRPLDRLLLRKKETKDEQ